MRAVLSSALLLYTISYVPTSRRRRLSHACPSPHAALLRTCSRLDTQGGETALMGAAENGRLECLDHLIATHLEKKAHLNAQVPTLAAGWHTRIGCH